MSIRDELALKHWTLRIVATATALYMLAWTLRYLAG